MKAKQFINFRSKYGNKRQTIDGISFDSKKEADYYLHLKLMKKAGQIKDFKRQVSFDLFAWVDNNAMPNQREKIGTHRVDFLVENTDGSQEVREVKGFATSLWDYKRKVFEANYPEIPYMVIR